ncbi:MAG: hypothetical protein AAB726_02690 [Patescibacteria group bacterium]
MKNKFIEINSPESFAYIGAKFTVSGWVHLSWFDSDTGRPDWRIFVDYLGLDVKVFKGGSEHPRLDDQNVRGDKIYFSINCELDYLNIHFIKKSHGRITLKIGSPNKAMTSIYLPLVVKQFETTATGRPEILIEHSEVGKKEIQYEQDLREYYKEMQKVYESRASKDHGKDYRYLYGDNTTMGFEIFQLIEEDTEKFDEYAYSLDDQREQDLNERYKDALEWRGPLLRGIVSQFNGFELRVYSNDHDKHFHVIHMGKGIDARFSFPDIRLIDYKSFKTTIGSRVEKKIREYCLQPEIFKKFEKEFAKRP